MCLTLPAQIISFEASDSSVLVDLSGQERRVRTAFMESAVIGDWVLVNADLAVAKISEKEANEINEFLK